MTEVIAQRDLRNDVSKVLARVRAGEDFIVTVNGEQVAELRPVARKGGTAAFVAFLQARGPHTPEQLAELDRVSAEVEAMDQDGYGPWP